MTGHFLLVRQCPKWTPVSRRQTVDELFYLLNCHDPLRHFFLIFQQPCHKLFAPRCFLELIWTGKHPMTTPVTLTLNKFDTRLNKQSCFQKVQLFIFLYIIFNDWFLWFCLILFRIGQNLLYHLLSWAIVVGMRFNKPVIPSLPPPPGKKNR